MTTETEAQTEERAVAAARMLRELADWFEGKDDACTTHEYAQSLEVAMLLVENVTDSLDLDADESNSHDDRHHVWAALDAAADAVSDASSVVEAYLGLTQSCDEDDDET